jgi:hypothetical protein
MEVLQIPRKLTALVKAAMRNTRCQIRIQNMPSDPIFTRNGGQQGDALACLLFNVALIRLLDYSLNTRGTTFYKSVQIPAYADDIVNTGRARTAMKESFFNLEKA